MEILRQSVLRAPFSRQSLSCLFVGCQGCYQPKATLCYSLGLIFFGPCWGGGVFFFFFKYQILERVDLLLQILRETFSFPTQHSGKDRLRCCGFWSLCVCFLIPSVGG